MTKEEIQNIIKEEGNYKEFKVRGIKCTIERHPTLKHLCGYIHIPKEVPGHGEHYDTFDIWCHGGLTFAGEGKDGLWILGFDCGHSGDLSPYRLLDKHMSSFPSFGGETYKDMDFVENELNDMVEQLNEKYDGLIDRINIKNIREAKLKDLENG
jgi:hypothetical protein